MNNTAENKELDMTKYETEEECKAIEEVLGKIMERGTQNENNN